MAKMGFDDVMKRAGKILDPRGGSADIRLWYDWYKGKVESFHTYWHYDGKSRVKFTKKSLQMAKQACEDWGSLINCEKCEIAQNQKTRLYALLDQLRFWSKLPIQTEWGMALGASVMALTFKNLEGTAIQTEEGKEILKVEKCDLGLEVYSQLRFIPLTLDDGEATEIAVFSGDPINEKSPFREVYFTKGDDGNYEVTIADRKATASAKRSWDVATIKLGSPVKPFSVFHPNVVNNREWDSSTPYISIFANAIDSLEVIDDVFDSYDNEFVLGRKRIFVSSDLAYIDPDDPEKKETFDSRDGLFYQLPPSKSINGADNTKDQIQEVNGSLRVADHDAALNKALSLFSKEVGLGTDYYSFEKGRVMTATQVISEKSDAFRNLKKHELVLETAIIDIVRAIEQYWPQFMGRPEEAFDMKQKTEVIFDDSVIEDKATEMANDRSDVAGGIMSKAEFRSKWYGESIADATKKIIAEYGDQALANRLNLFTPAWTQGALTTEDFVKLVYVGYPDQASLVAKLDEAKKSASSISPSDLAGIGNFQ